MGTADNFQIRTAHDWMEVGPGSTEASAPKNVFIEGGKAFLAEAVDILGEIETCLLNRLEECLKQGSGSRSTFHFEGAAASAEFIFARKTVFHLFEIRQAMGIVPLFHSFIPGPAFVIQRIATLKDHAVDAAGASEYFSTTLIDPSSVHERLGFGLIDPVIEWIADGYRKPGGHMDEDVPDGIWPSCLQKQYPIPRIFTESVRQNTTRGTATDDDKIVGFLHGLNLLFNFQKDGSE